MDEGIFGASTVRLENNGAAEAPISDTITLENLGADGGAQGPSIEFPRSFITHDPAPQRDFSKFQAAALALRKIRERKDPGLLKGGIHNAIAALDASLNIKDYDHALMLYFGRPVSDEEAAGEIDKIYSLAAGTEQAALAEFMGLPQERQDEIAAEYAQEHSANKPKMAAVSGMGAFGNARVVQADNPAYDPQKAKEEYLQALREKDFFSAYQNCRARFGGAVVSDAMEFIRAENWRSDLADAYVAKLAGADRERAQNFIAAVSMLSPKSVAGFWKRVGVQLGERGTDTWTNIRQWFSAGGQFANPDTVYSWAREVGAFDDDGRPTENFARLRERVGPYSEGGEPYMIATRENPYSFGADTFREANKHSDSDLKAMYEEGRRRFEQRKLFRELRALAATRYDYSDVGAAEKLLEDVVITGAEMLKYAGVGAAATAATGGNVYAGIAASGSLIYMEEASDMYDSLIYDGAMAPEKAAHYAALYGATAAALEQFQVTRFAKTLRGSSYLLKGDPLQKTFREYMKHDLKELPKTWLREGGAETFTEFAQGLADYGTKRWVAAHENADFDENALWEEYKEGFVETAKVMPTLMAFTTLFGFGVNANRRRIASGASIKGFFSPSEAVDNTLRTQSAVLQLEKHRREMNSQTDSLSDKYGADFLEGYIAADGAGRETMLAGKFPEPEERARFSEDFARLGDMLEAHIGMEKAAERQSAKVALEAQRKHEEEAAKLESEYMSLPEVRDESDNMALVRSFLDRFGGSSGVVFVESEGDLPLNMRAKAPEILSDMAKRGFFNASDGKIYLFTPHFKSPVDALRTLVHERGHWILSQLKGDPSYGGMLERVNSILGPSVIRAALPESYAALADRDAAEEYAVRVMERIAMKQALDERQKGVFRTFKNWLGRMIAGENTLSDIADREIAQIASELFRASNEAARISEFGEWSASTPEENGATVGGKYMLLDAASLTTSTDEGYDDTLQPRNRSRRGSVEQVAKIATNLDPLRLDYSVTTDDGSPIVDDKGQVISGNGRVLAIRQAYRDYPERALNYKNYVLRRAREMGLAADAGMEAPVLVRRVDDLGGMSLQEFAARSNKSKVAAMSNAEQAVADARRILEVGNYGGRILDLFFPSDSGDVLAETNSPFISAFLEAVGGREQYIDKNGKIKANLAPRIRSAVLAAMLNPEGADGSQESRGKRDIVESLLDNPDGWSGLIRGLMGSAASLGKLAGNPDYDLSGDLSQAVELYINLRREGRTLAEYNAQAEMFEAPPSNEVGFLVQLFEANTKSPSGISGVLNEYYRRAKNIDTSSQDMFGEENPSKFNVLQNAFEVYSSENPQEKWREDGPAAEYGRPSPEETAETERQAVEVEAKYRGSPQWMKAPNGRPTKLTEKQWLQVRTPNFKRWFGDWERLALINEIEKMPATKVKTHEALDKAGIKQAFKTFGEVENKRDGRRVVFPSASAGKIERHKGFATNTIIRNFKTLFEGSLPVLSEKEVRKEGHKEHRNFDGYEHYITKIAVNGTDYYIRFTVMLEHKGRELMHSSFVSEVSIYKERTRPAEHQENLGGETSPQEASTLTLIQTPGSSSSSFIDGKLADFLGSVKPESVSRVVDENGEPLVVYHGTRNEFTAFDRDRIGERGSVRGPGFYFTSEYGQAYRFANGMFSRPGDGGSGNIMPVFLSIKNPSRAAKGVVLPDGKFDGVIDGQMYVAFSPEQIKSATDNAGTFSDSPDIRWKIDDARVEKAIADVEREFEAAEDSEYAAKGAYVKKHLDSFEKVFDEDLEGEVYRSEYGYDIFPNGEYFFVPDYDDGRELFTSLKSAAETSLETFYENNAEDYKPNPRLADIERFEEALGRIGIRRIRVKEAGTGTMYAYVNGLKIRFADHDALYQADFSVSPNEGSWQDAVRFVVSQDDNSDIRWKIDDERHSELYERYKSGDKAALDEAAELAADAARRAGYETKVYHGTGANGFYVADASSSNSEYGEGNQAHGAGLYMAASRTTAEEYRRNGSRKIEHFELDGTPLTGENLEKFAKSANVDWGDALDVFDEYLRIYGYYGRIYDFDSISEKVLKEYDERIAYQEEKLADDDFSSEHKKRITEEYLEELKRLRSATVKIRDYISGKKGFKYVKSKGHLFDWFHNMKPDELFDEENPDSVVKSPVGEKYQKAWVEDILPILRREYGYDEDELDDAKRRLRGLNSAKTILRNASTYLGGDRFREIMLKHGIRGVTYDGRQDGRCFVSFEGGATVKLQDPFTFDDEGRLIPLSERFDTSNPDIRWRIDEGDASRFRRELQDYIDGKLDRRHVFRLGTTPEVMRLVGVDELPIELSASVLERKEAKHGLVLDDLKNLPHELANPIAILQSEQKGDSIVVLTELPTVSGNTLIIAVDLNKKFGKFEVNSIRSVYHKNNSGIQRWVDNGDLLYINTQKKPHWLKLPLLQSRGRNKNQKGLYGRKVFTEADISQAEKDSFPGLLSEDMGEGLIRELVRQERGNNPLVWASIVLAKRAIEGNAITRAAAEKLLPGDVFDGSHYEKVMAKAKEVAEIARAKYSDRPTDQAVQMAESHYHWNVEVMEKLYMSFRKDGEIYGEYRQKLLNYIRNRREAQLRNVRGYGNAELGVDMAGSILKAMQKEPERPKLDESAEKSETEIEDLEAESDGWSDGLPVIPALPLVNGDIPAIIFDLKKRVIALSRQADDSAAAMLEKYRKTLAEALRDAANKLVYGHEKQAIMDKIHELERVKYAVITPDEGPHAGQKTDNLTLRAEHIALRIFNRGVWDSRKALTEKLWKLLKAYGKKPSRMERDDKRRFSAAVQNRIHKIREILAYSPEEVAEAYAEVGDKLENADRHFVDNEGGTPMEDSLARATELLCDLNMFGNWAGKNRAQMADAVDFLENRIEGEMEEHARRVEEQKAENDKKRALLAAALRSSKRNAKKDGQIGAALRQLATGSMPFDSFLGVLGEAATGETRAAFEEWRDDLCTRIFRASDAASNEVYFKQNAFYKKVAEIYKTKSEAALKRLWTPQAGLERFSAAEDGMQTPLAPGNILQLLAAAEQEQYLENFYLHRTGDKSERFGEIQSRIDEIRLSFPDIESKRTREWAYASDEIETLEIEKLGIMRAAVKKYTQNLREALTDGDLKLLEWLRGEYKNELPDLNRAARPILGMAIESEDPLYVPVKMYRPGGMEEGAPTVPVVPKTLTPRVPNKLDVDEGADIVKLYFQRMRENAQFKAMAGIYIEMRALFGDAEIQTLIRERCGADVLRDLKEFVADIASGQTRGMRIGPIDRITGAFAIVQLGWNLGSGLRQLAPGVFSWGVKIGTGNVLKHLATCFTPDGWAAIREIAHSDTFKRRWGLGGVQVLEELLANPDQNAFKRWYKRNALIFNRIADLVSITLIGQGVYRAGREMYLRKGLSAEQAGELAMSDMWQIAERTQASGKIMNMSRWQRRGGSIGRSVGLFSSPPQLMFSKAMEDLRRARALGLKSSEGRLAYFKALRTWVTIACLVEGSYAFSSVIWNALIKGEFDDDEGDKILQQMLAGPFGGLFFFGRMADSIAVGRPSSIIPAAGMVRPVQYGIDVAADVICGDWDSLGEDADKLGASLLSPWREIRKGIKAREPKKDL